MKKNNTFIIIILLAFLAALSIPMVDGNAVSEFLGSSMNLIVVVMGAFIIISLWAVVRAMESLRTMLLRKEGRFAEIGEDEHGRVLRPASIEIEKKENFWQRAWQKMQDAKPVEEEGEIELDHEYDGIRELDNNLPPWWLWGFYLSIAFSVIYILRYHVFETAPLQIEEYEIQLAEGETMKEKYLKTAANLVDENNVEPITETALLDEAGKIYTKNCAVCHGPDGGGTVGPNLTDEFWLHGGSLNDIFSTIKYGVPAKGMIAWKDQLSPKQIQQLSSYIHTLQGTNPANPKAPEGDKYTPEESTPAGDAENMEITTEDESSEDVAKAP